MENPFAELPSNLTALDSRFPEFLPSDDDAICFNLRPGDVDFQPDPFFHWQGSYFELENGVPKNAYWQKAFHSIANESGFGRVCNFCTRTLQTGDRVFYKPGKAKRWLGMLGPDGKKPTTTENVLVRRQSDEGIRWSFIEVVDKDGEVSEWPVSERALSRLTYPLLQLALEANVGDSATASEVVPGETALCEQVWLDGSTLIRRVSDQTGSDAADAHIVRILPSSCHSLRFVPLDRRVDFLRSVASAPTFAVTGATLNRDSVYGSALSVEVAMEVGVALAAISKMSGICTMASASMRAHHAAMSADHDLTLGFVSNPECRAIHFKGSNAVRLDGDAWRMGHGTSYLIEEEALDFSNHAKEACLMACATHEHSIALCANGGPTVACNVARFLTLCSSGSVFTICGMHSPSGTSGAAVSFHTSKQQLAAAIDSLIKLAPSFFEAFVKEREADGIAAVLLQRSLRLLDVGSETEIESEACQLREYVVQPDAANEVPSPGLGPQQASLLKAYAVAVSKAILCNTGRDPA
eukprot:TRINITY_DN50682_c0_g1_i1.p1 TRINITY_DN50682_c0_g1~~TRINITY_DN50682_c0_g1_i1.p1  ORF type:complete len:525 (-),score=96.98 TRINITY_DN50682_c0_g1_i1:199-1773(-)